MLLSGKFVVFPLIYEQDCSYETEMFHRIMTIDFIKKKFSLSYVGVI